MGSHFLLQVVFPTQGSNLRFLQWQAASLLLGHQGSPVLALEGTAVPVLGGPTIPLDRH